MFFCKDIAQHTIFKNWASSYDFFSYFLTYSFFYIYECDVSDPLPHQTQGLAIHRNELKWWILASTETDTTWTKHALSVLFKHPILVNCFTFIFFIEIDRNQLIRLKSERNQFIRDDEWACNLLELSIGPSFAFNLNFFAVVFYIYAFKLKIFIQIYLEGIFEISVFEH